MSYMKRLWLEREMERQDAVLDSMDHEAAFPAVYCVEEMVEQDIYVDQGQFTCEVPKRIGVGRRHEWAWNHYYKGAQAHLISGSPLPDGVRRVDSRSGMQVLMDDERQKPIPPIGHCDSFACGKDETSKAEGTRDVEKFLKEQQEAMWRDW